jgi:hypothetical protein
VWWLRKDRKDKEGEEKRTEEKRREEKKRDENQRRYWLNSVLKGHRMENISNEGEFYRNPRWRNRWQSEKQKKKK